MDKFLEIEVTSAGKTLLSCNDVVSVTTGSNAADATTTVVTYKSGTYATITTPAQTDYSIRNQIQDSMVRALETGWTNVAFPITPLLAVSEIVYT